jgi:hypothetical protein
MTTRENDSEFIDTLFMKMAFYGFTNIWYSNPWPIGSSPTHDTPGQRWFAGVWTGPENDMLCLKICATNEEAEQWLSPAGYDLRDAIELAIKKLEDLRAQ